jgi:hypothetical protein
MEAEEVMNLDGLGLPGLATKGWLTERRPLYAYLLTYFLRKILKNYSKR